MHSSVATLCKPRLKRCANDDRLATPAVAPLAQRESIYLDQRFSDHAPLTIDYDYDFVL